MTRPRRACVALLALAGLLILSSCRFGGTAQVVDEQGNCSQIVMPTVDVHAPTAPTTLPGVQLAPCPTSSAPPPTTPATMTTPASTTTTPPATSTSTAPPPRSISAYVTGYSFYDNTPPGSPEISNPVLHKTAGGTGTYDDPITVAVGHNMSSGRDVLDWPAGARFYVPNLRRYLIVEDTCGDGPRPQNGPCHTGYPASASTWLDVWVDGRDGTAAAADACMDKITTVSSVLVNPPRGYMVQVGPIASRGQCAGQFGNTPVTTTPSAPPATTPPASPPPATTPPAAGDGATAAAARSWGQPVAGDEFNYTGAPASAKWGVYDGAGHGGNGRRVPQAFSVDGSVLRVHGDERGNSGGMAYKGGQYRGKWEARMRAPAGDGDYHPVLLLWPDAEDWPRGGEVDYAEVSDAGRQSIDFFLHYGASNSQTHAGKRIDVTAWHNYAVEWSGSCITGYIDAAQWFSDCNAGHLPPGPMHMTVQLDAFDGTGPYTPSDMFVDWVRQYAA